MAIVTVEQYESPPLTLDDLAHRILPGGGKIAALAAT